ncbi:carbohydrate kinase family protein [Thermogemmatispora sp.]|uniref:carbohydrate kinase family protein n=1 Tax=Thermogemmatispora sp. TaxID=1968838 RepID=UPI001D96F78B|nr:carbohydrate kinase family protein [Thermogemmatispora sp.]MBX5450729.1 carbohydrate kinase family protein [Thermogemmatispora sp.]
MERNEFDVLIIGNPCIDLIFSGLPHWPAPGKEVYATRFAIGAGAVFNTAAALSRLGLRVALLGELGNDCLSRYLLEEMRQAGICCDLVRQRDERLAAVSVALVHDGERGFVSYAEPPARPALDEFRNFEEASTLAPELLPPLTLAELRALLSRYRWRAAFLHVHPALGPVLELLAQQRITIFLDTGWHPRLLGDPRLPEVLRQCSVFLPNRLEAEALTGTHDPVAAARQLAQFVPLVVIKLGAEGALACQGEQLWHCPAWPVSEVIDPTGAGDAFDAGFIYALLHGYSLPEALRCGTICGSLATTALTGSAAVPDATELERLRHSSP